MPEKRQKDKSTFCHFIDISKYQYEDIIGFYKDPNLSDKIPFMVSGSFGIKGLEH